ncbi:MAG TPA: TolC family protein [Chitinophagaceae bacterium]|nr:TolC family protein [Chitinophagaceae bacterium]
MKHRLITTGFLLCCVLLQLPVHAQEQKKLTLADAVQLSLANSKQLKNSSARIAEATAVLQQANDRKLPDFNINASYLRLTTPTISLKSKGSGSSDSSSGGGFGNVNQAMYAMATISYPIYSGSRIKYGIESARYLQQASLLDSAHDRGEVIINTIGAYINLYKAGEAVQLVKENLAQSRQRDTDFANLEKNGILARNDLLKAQLQTSNIELSLLDAENNWKLANVNMNLLLGLPESTILELDSASLAYAPELKTVDEYEQIALQNRKDMLALSNRAKAAASNIKSVKGEYYPSIGLTGGYAAINIPGLAAVTNAIDVGVGVKYSLSSLWKTKAKLKEAQAKEDELVSNEELLVDNMHFQVNQAYENYLLSIKKIDVYTKAIEQANENYKITKNKYDNQLATTTDLLEADVAQLQAKLNYAFAKADAVVAYNKLIQTAGILTEPTNK